MFAYNHSIEFIPALKNAKTITSSSSNTITIRENSSRDPLEKLDYQMTFTNNQGRNLALYTDRHFARRVQGQQWAFDVKEVMTFFWNSGGLTIEYLPAQNFTPELLEYWTLHIFLPIFLTIEEHFYFLHAGSVEIDDAPILFVAESFGGKSTMTDFFIKHGHAMVSDDKVAILEENGKILAVPSHPHHRPYRKMEDLGYFVNNMVNTPKPIYAIYALHRVEADAPIAIRELQGIEKFKTIRFSSELDVSFLKTKRFRALGSLAENIPVYKVMVPWDIERLEEVYIAIVEHSHVLRDSNTL